MRIIENIVYYVIGIMIFSIFMGAIFYSLGQMNNAILIKEILFWSALSLLFVLQLTRIMSDVFVRNWRKNNG